MHEDRMFLGASIRGQAAAVGDDQQHVSYNEVTAEVDHAE